MPKVPIGTLPVWWASNVGVTPSDLTTNLQNQVKQIMTSFEANEQGSYPIYFAQNVTITGWTSVVTKNLAATDAGVLQLKNSAGANMGSGSISLPASTTAGTVTAGTAPTSNNVVAAGSFANVVATKATSGGKVLVALFYTIAPAG